MRTVPISPDLRDRYARYVSASAVALLYHSRVYVDFLCDLLGATDRSLVALTDEGEVTGVLPMLARPGPAGIVLNSLPFYGSHGGVLTEEPEIAQSLIDAFAQQAHDATCVAATLVENLRDPWAYANFGATHADERIGQISPIGHNDNHAERLMVNFHYKTRNMVRKSQRSGLSTLVDNTAFDVLERMHRENLTALGGRPKPTRFFNLIDRYFRPDQDYRLYLACKNGLPVSALLLFYFGTTVEYFVPATQMEFRELQPLTLLIFEAMSDASKRGYCWWNWGGTWKNQDGVYRFKKRWGTQDYPYRYHTIVNRTAVLEWPKERILAEYPYFYVAPFSALVSHEMQS